MKGLVIVMAAVIIILLGALSYCPRQKETTKTVFKKGQEIVRLVHGKPDTVIKKIPIHHYHKGTVKIQHDTIHHYSTSVDLVNLPGISIAISDTLAGDSIRRLVKVLKIDTVRTITRTDTLYKERTDSVFITKTVHNKGFLKGVTVGAGIVIAAGLLIR